jgi:hypothetical protein
MPYDPGYDNEGNDLTPPSDGAHGSRSWWETDTGEAVSAILTLFFLVAIIGFFCWKCG